MIEQAEGYVLAVVGKEGRIPERGDLRRTRQQQQRVRRQRLQLGPHLEGEHFPRGCRKGEELLRAGTEHQEGAVAYKAQPGLATPGEALLYVLSLWKGKVAGRVAGSAVGEGTVAEEGKGLGKDDVPFGGEAGQEYGSALEVARGKGVGIEHLQVGRGDELVLMRQDVHAALDHAPEGESLVIPDPLEAEGGGEGLVAGGSLGLSWGQRAVGEGEVGEVGLLGGLYGCPPLAAGEDH